MTTFIKNKCQSYHAHHNCLNNYEYMVNNIESSTLTQQMVEQYLIMLDGGRGQSYECLKMGNKNYLVHKQLITELSKTFKIGCVSFTFFNVFTDDELFTMLQNQVNLNSMYITFMDTNITKHIIIMCIANLRIKTLNFLLNTISTELFLDTLYTRAQYIVPNSEVEEKIATFIGENREKLKKHNSIIGNIRLYAKNYNIFFVIYKYFSVDLNDTERTDLLLKSFEIGNFSESQYFNILNLYPIVLNMDFINVLFKKYVYIVSRTTMGNPYKDFIARVVSIFIIFGMKVTKNVIIDLLKNGCHVNDFEKYGIEMDNELLLVCSTYNYYPYKFYFAPDNKVMMCECGKNDNYVIINQFVEKGGIMDTGCLETACNVRNNGKVINYLINDLKIVPNKKCLTNFELTYCLQGLCSLMSSYSEHHEIKKEPVRTTIELNETAVLTIDEKKETLKPEQKYIIKKEFKNMFKKGKKQLTFTELCECVFEYLTKNNLIIGNYFVVNEEMNVNFKIPQCSILKISQIHTLLTYIVE